MRAANPGLDMFNPACLPHSLCGLLRFVLSKQSLNRPQYLRNANQVSDTGFLTDSWSWSVRPFSRRDDLEQASARVLTQLLLICETNDLRTCICKTSPRWTCGKGQYSVCSDKCARLQVGVTCGFVTKRGLCIARLRLPFSLSCVTLQAPCTVFVIPWDWQLFIHRTSPQHCPVV